MKSTYFWENQSRTGFHSLSCNSTNVPGISASELLVEKKKRRRWKKKKRVKVTGKGKSSPFFFTNNIIIFFTFYNIHTSRSEPQWWLHCPYKGMSLVVIIHVATFLFYIYTNIFRTIRTIWMLRERNCKDIFVITTQKIPYLTFRLTCLIHSLHFIKLLAGWYSETWRHQLISWNSQIYSRWVESKQKKKIFLLPYCIRV